MIEQNKIVGKPIKRVSISNAKDCASSLNDVHSGVKDYMLRLNNGYSGAIEREGIVDKLFKSDKIEDVAEEINLDGIKQDKIIKKRDKRGRFIRSTSEQLVQKLEEQFNSKLINQVSLTNPVSTILKSNILSRNQLTQDEIDRIDKRVVEMAKDGGEFMTCQQLDSVSSDKYLNDIIEENFEKIFSLINSICFGYKSKLITKYIYTKNLEKPNLNDLFTEYIDGKDIKSKYSDDYDEECVINEISPLYNIHKEKLSKKLNDLISFGVLKNLNDINVIERKRK